MANRSDVPLNEVVVKFPSHTEEYGNIAPHDVTDYRTVQRAYPYAYVEVLVEGKQAILQPYDYTGERLLSAGQYTYALRYNPEATGEHDRLRFQLENK